MAKTRIPPKTKVSEAFSINSIDENILKVSTLQRSFLLRRSERRRWWIVREDQELHVRQHFRSWQKAFSYLVNSITPKW